MALLAGSLSPVMAQEAEDFSKPLRFSVIGDGVTQLPIELDYDLTQEDRLRLGDTFISADSFKIRIGTIDDISVAAAPYAGENERRGVVLLLQWPLALVDMGFLEAIGQSGRVLWKTPIPESEILAWGEFTGEMRTRMQANLKKEDLDTNPILNSTWILRDFIERSKELVDSQENFRFCVSRKNELGQTRLCSAYMGLRQKNRKWELEDVPEALKPARIISFQKQSPLKARRRIKGRGLVQFLAELNNGFIYEFVSRPPKVEIVEMVRGDKHNIKMVGFGQTPSIEHRILNPLEESFIVRTFKWQETIGDFRRYWEVDVDKATDTLYFPGPGGGLFKQSFQITRLPRESARPMIDYRTPAATYSNGAKIFGSQAKNTLVTSDEVSLTPLDETNDLFLWYFQAENRGLMNRAHVRVQDGDEMFKAYYEMYKGYPRELSFRSSAILGSGGNILINAEAAFNYWFEDILGWSNSTFSRQRWGLSGKYFQSVTPLKISKTSAALRNITVDLKYRLRPGLWGRDESWGLILGLNDISYDIFTAKQGGVGFFWARSMPRLFDDLFNIVPIMRYPKWVDLEFIYYPAVFSSPGSTVNNPPAGTGNWAMNFHGKVMWTKSFFGEAGFGMRNLDMNRDVQEDLVRRLRFQFISVYGTAGLGYQF